MKFGHGWVLEANKGPQIGNLQLKKLQNELTWRDVTRREGELAASEGTLEDVLEVVQKVDESVESEFTNLDVVYA